MESSRDKVGILTRNTVLFTVSNLGSKIITFLLVPLYTFALSTSDYGIADFIISISMVVIPIITLNIKDAVLRFALDENYYAKDVFSASFIIIIGGNFLLLASICALQFFEIISWDKINIIYFVIICFLNSFEEISAMYLKAIGKIRLIVIGGMTRTFFTALSAIFLLLILRLGLTGYFLSYIGGAMICIVAYCFWGGILHDIHVLVNKDVLAEMCSFSTPLIVNALSWWVNSLSDRFFVVLFLGVSENGIYSIAYKIPLILATIQNVFYNAWSISAIKDFDEKDSDGFIGTIYECYMAISILVSACIVLFNIPIARLLYSKDFYNAYTYVPILVVGTVFNGIALFEGCLFTAKKKTKEISITTALGAMVNTMLNVLLIPNYGAMGAAIATAFGYFIICAIRTIKLKEIIILKLDILRFIVSFLLLLFQVFCANIYPNTKLMIIVIVLQIVILKEYIKKTLCLLKMRRRI